MQNRRENRALFYARAQEGLIKPVRVRDSYLEAWMSDASEFWLGIVSNAACLHSWASGYGCIIQNAPSKYNISRVKIG